MLHWLPGEALVILLSRCYSLPRCRSAIAHRPVWLHLQGRSCSTRTGAKWRLGRRQQANSVVTPGSSSYSSNRVAGLPLIQSLHRSYTSQESTSNSKDDSENIAIIGGGITGLTAAYYLSQFIPTANITLYEVSERMGGWLQSKHINIGDGRIVFEQGPRNLRPNAPAGLITLEMIKAIGLEDEIIITSKDSVAAQNRYVYYPDRLIRMPSPRQGILEAARVLTTEPIFDNVFSSLSLDYFNPRRSSEMDDESVGAFLQRRLGTRALGDNLVSAIVHGIYAGDIYQLSVKSLLPIAWHLEGKYGSLVGGFFARFKRFPFAIIDELKMDDAAMYSYMQGRLEFAGGLNVIESSVYSFKQGVGTLTDGLTAALRSAPRVTLKTDAKVKRIAFDRGTNTVKISSGSGHPPIDYDRVISTIPGRTLSQLTGPDSELPSLSKIHAVTVMVVNLYYTNPALLPVHGFGYLIPRSVPWDQNPEFALGVVFDSDANVGQDTVPGTKVTVMLGGHWWDGWPSYPDEAEGAAMAKAVLKRHLKIEEEPLIVNVGLQKDCIPQYTVGHRARMKKAHEELMEEFNGKLTVAGNSYTGVGLNDCVWAGKGAAALLRVGLQEEKSTFRLTGLEHFTREVEFVQGIRPGPLHWLMPRLR